MIALVTDLFDTSGFPPRWQCGNWTSGLGWLHIISDLLIWLAYLTIPLVILFYIRRRRDVPFRPVFWLFGAFIVSCGLTHLADAIVFYAPIYRFAGIIKLITALVSWATVIALVRILPQAITMKPLRQLEEEVEARTVELRELNAELRQSEERFRLVVESNPNGIVMIDDAGKITLVNARTEKMFGFDRSELLGQSVELLVPEKFRETHPGDRAGFFARPEVRSMGMGRDLRGRRKDGEEFPVEIGLNPIRTENGLHVLGVIVDITARKTEEEEISRSRAMLKLVLDNIPQGVFWKDRDSRYLGCNPVVARAGGLASPEAIVGLLDADLPALTPDQAAFFVAKDREVMESGVALSDVVEQMTLADGRTIWLNTNKIPMRDPLGRVTGVLGTWQDITERRQAEEALRAGEELFRSAFDHTNVAMVVKDLSHRFVRVNAAFARMFGYSEHELLSLSMPDITHPDDAAESHARREPLLAGESNTLEMEIRYVLKDGRTVWGLTNISIVRDENWKPLRYVGQVQDITERKLAQEALRNSELRYQQTLDEMLEGCQIISFDWRYVYVNATTLLHGRKTREELLGKTMMEAYPGIEQTEVFARIRRCMEERVSAQLENQFVYADGSSAWFELSVQPSPDGVFILTIDITPRKLAEEALRLSERRFRALLEHGTDSISLIDADNHILYLSPSVAAVEGYSAEDLAGRNGIENTHPDDVPLVRDVVGRLLAAPGRPIPVTWRRRHKDGRWIWLEGVATNLLDDPAVGGIVTNYRDITARKQAEVEIYRLNSDLERRVRERTAELHEAQRLARVGSWIWHVDDDRVEWTTELYRIFGRDPGSPPPTYLEQAVLYVPESWERLRTAVGEALHSGMPYGLELEIRRLAGTPRTISCAGEAERDADGRIVRLRGTVQDITELRKTEEALRLVSERLILATQAGQVGVWDWDVVADRLDWDDSMFALYGITAGQFSGAYEAWQAGVHPEDRVRGDEEIHQALRGEKEFDTEFRVLWPDRTVHTIRARAIVQRDHDGRPTRMTGTNWDITQMKQAEESIRALNEDLRQRAAEVEAANKELEAFSYSVSHDLRAPLRAVDGFSRIVLEDFAAQMPGEARDFLQDIRAGAQQMGRLVDDLLAFSRLSRQQLRKDSFSATELVRRCLDELQSTHQGRRVETIVGDLPPCYGDSALLKQVWINLIANALKYSGKRDPAVIEIGFEREGDVPAYFVRDNGVGFDMRYVDKLFGVFQRLHRAEDYEGTGVGLAIVQRIIHRHGGRVWARAELNRGATFYFTLPAPGESPHG